MRPDQEEELKKASISARELTYSPYSHFPVGCAVLFGDGRIVRGSNVENASYGAGICAERSALVSARMAGHSLSEIEAIAISSNTDKTISPCGICRQFIREFAPLTVPIYMCNRNADTVDICTLEELLPLSFGPEHLH